MVTTAYTPAVSAPATLTTTSSSKMRMTSPASGDTPETPVSIRILVAILVPPHVATAARDRCLRQADHGRSPLVTRAMLGDSMPSSTAPSGTSNSSQLGLLGTANVQP